MVNPLLDPEVLSESGVVLLHFRVLSLEFVVVLHVVSEALFEDPVLPLQRDEPDAQILDADFVFQQLQLVFQILVFGVFLADLVLQISQLLASLREQTLFLRVLGILLLGLEELGEKAELVFEVFEFLGGSGGEGFERGEQTCEGFEVGGEVVD